MDMDAKTMGRERAETTRPKVDRLRLMWAPQVIRWEHVWKNFKVNWETNMEHKHVENTLW